jgi:hypothetical protein
MEDLEVVDYMICYIKADMESVQRIRLRAVADSCEHRNGYSNSYNMENSSTS